MLMQFIKTLFIAFLSAIFLLGCSQDNSRKAPEEIKKKVDSLDKEVMEELKEAPRDSAKQ